MTHYRIKDRWHGNVLYEADGETFCSVVESAIKSRAYLSRADLSRANLSRADLSGANLSGAYGIAYELACLLAILLDQPGELVAYKLVNGADEGIYNGGLAYTDGATLSVNAANTDSNDDCGAGINVATLQWLLPLFHSDVHRVKAIHFTAADIACIPTATDGKFRLHRCRVGTAEENAAITERVRKLYAQIHASKVVP